MPTNERNRLFVASSLANDPHTEGMHNASKIAAMGGVQSLILSPSLDYTAFYEAIDRYKPRYVGLSYRQNADVAVHELFKVVNYFSTSGLIKKGDDVKIFFSGLPKTIQILKEKVHELPLPVILIQDSPNIREKIAENVDLFDIVQNREDVIQKVYEELVPKGIELLDQWIGYRPCAVICRHIV